MVPAHRPIFLPPSWRAGYIRQAIETAAAEQGLSFQFVADRATDASVEGPASQITLYQQLDYDALTLGAADWLVVLPPGSEDCVRLFQTLHPDLGRSWAATHGSEGIAAALWLVEHGAQITTEGALRIGQASLKIEDPHPPSTTAAPELALYSSFGAPLGRTWRIDDSLAANSPNYVTDLAGWHDLTGRARHLLVGPHTFLPSGTWRIDIEFDVDVEQGKPRFLFEWGGAALERTRFSTIIRKSGRYQVALESHFARPDAAHCLIATDAAQLQSKFRLSSCALTRLEGSHHGGAPRQALPDSWA